MEEEFGKSGKEKPCEIAIPQGKDKKLSGTEEELIVGIPPVRRIGVVCVHPELVTIIVEVEHVRVAVAVYLYTTPSITPFSSCGYSMSKNLSLILCVILNHGASYTKYFLF
ncbi:MAG: hypothetical protein V1896_02835 [Candidatus Zambryskibacteria bacterium]